MNRRDKQNVVDKLKAQYLRSEKGDFANGNHSQDYTEGWRDALRTVAVQLGVYDEFIKKVEDAPAAKTHASAEG